VQQSDEMQVINRKMSYSAPRTYTIDEDFLGAIISEVNSLRQTIVELEHHLIGVRAEYYSLYLIYLLVYLLI